MCGCIGNCILARDPIRPNSVWKALGVIGPSRSDIKTCEDSPCSRCRRRANKNGFMYVIDRTNGKLIAAHPLVKVNWASHIDLKTGRPVLTAQQRLADLTIDMQLGKHRLGQAVEVEAFIWNVLILPNQ